MRSSLPVIVVVSALIALLAVGVPWGVHLALPAAALATAAVVLIHRPGVAGWRWAALGSGLWGVEEGLWALERLAGLDVPILATDTFYFGGAIAWLIALHLLPGRFFPTRILLAALPPVALLVWFLIGDPATTLRLQFPIVDVALLLFAFPLLEAAFRGHASEGRLLWGLGFLVRALAAAGTAWTFDQSVPQLLLLLLWLFGHTFIAIGVWLELRKQQGDVATTAYALLGLEAVIGLMVALIYLGGDDRTGPLIVVNAVLGYTLFAGVILVIAADRQRRLQAERELEQWSRLLERLVAFAPGGGSSRETLQTLMQTVAAFYPGLCGIELRTGETVRVGVTAGYAFPLVGDGTELGHLYFREQPAGDALSALSPLLAAQIRQALSQVAWQEQAFSDPLTGLLNRRGLQRDGERLAARAHEQGEAVSVAVLDLDHFKRVNDLYGHPTGDDALRALAAILQANTRQHDLCVRWGGEEFVLVLYGSGLDGAREIVRRVRDDLRQKAIPPIRWPLTVSAGVAGGAAPEDGERLLVWIARADRALLDAKAAGRDRIEVVPLA